MQILIQTALFFVTTQLPQGHNGGYMAGEKYKTIYFSFIPPMVCWREQQATIWVSNDPDLWRHYTYMNLLRFIIPAK